MYTYTASVPLLIPLLELLELNGVDYAPVWPNDEPVLGFFRTKLRPDELLPYLEAAKGSEGSIIPLDEETVKNCRIRHTIRKRSADLAYVTDGSARAAPQSARHLS